MKIPKRGTFERGSNARPRHLQPLQDNYLRQIGSRLGFRGGKQKNPNVGKGQRRGREREKGLREGENSEDRAHAAFHVSPWTTGPKEFQARGSGSEPRTFGRRTFFTPSLDTVLEIWDNSPRESSLWWRTTNPTTTFMARAHLSLLFLLLIIRYGVYNIIHGWNINTRRGWYSNEISNEIICKKLLLLLVLFNEILAWECGTSSKGGMRTAIAINEELFLRGGTRALLYSAMRGWAVKSRPGCISWWI